MKDFGIAEIRNIISSTGIINKIEGYFIGYKYSKVKIGDSIVVIDNIKGNIKHTFNKVKGGQS